MLTGLAAAGSSQAAGRLVIANRRPEVDTRADGALSGLSQRLAERDDDHER